MNILSITTTSDMLSATLIGILIVFCVLSLLVLSFKLSGYISIKSSEKRMLKQSEGQHTTESVKGASQIPASEIAAISMALYSYFEDVHDKESNVITIKRIERRYSPWNSKIYGLTNLIR